MSVNKDVNKSDVDDLIKATHCTSQTLTCRKDSMCRTSRSCDVTPIKLIHFAHAIRVVTNTKFSPIVAIHF